jgi:Flp pilus assembly protein TadG
MLFHATFESFLRLLKRFYRSESGMTLPLLAISMIMITGMVGIAIDTARAQMVQSKLQFSLDAAGLAGGSTVSTSDLNTEVNKYLNVNFNGYLGSTISSVNISTNSSNTTITLAATATLPSTFMAVLGINTLTVNANSQISRAVTGLELVLVLDNTGSMNNSAGGGVSKISALQTAANALITTLFNGQQTAPKNLYVGIVPFSQAVNIGTSHTTWMNTTYDNTLNWYTTSWAGCVDARLNGEDTVDDPPVSSNANTLFEAYYWPSDTAATIQSKLGTSSSNATSMFNNYSQWPTYNSQYGLNIWQGKVSNIQRYASPLDTLHQGPNYLCPQQVTPMTTSLSTLTTAINGMVAEGDTLINQGLQWGWNMLSPRWNGLWGGTMNANNLPLPYHTSGMNKAIVLLTDGENTIDNVAHGAYWYLSNNRLGSTNGTTAVNTLNSRTLALCTAMKNNGVYIYTIALGTDTTPTSLALLQSCATGTNYYFNSPSTTQLQSIFSAIGDSLSNLRVSQ